MLTLNQFLIIGRVGGAPKTFGKIAKLSIATDRHWTDKDGQAKSATDWVTVSIVDAGQAEWAAATLNKGDGVFVKARVAETKYEKDGQRVYGVDIVASMLTLVQSGGKQTSGDA
jgi:single stranded DNA-binding protein